MVDAGSTDLVPSLADYTNERCDSDWMKEGRLSAKLR